MSLILPRISRRSFLASSVAASATLALPAISRAGSRPVFAHGVQSGDITTQGGMVWTFRLPQAASTAATEPAEEAPAEGATNG